AFYSVVAGWTVGYLWKALTGSFAVEMTGEQSAALFGELIGSPVQAIALSGLFLLLTIFVVRGGISGGIERVTTVLMPVLLVLLVVLAIRSVTLPGALEGVEYLFKPDFSKISAGVVLNALGQALFSLSLGMGAMITYGSYFPDKENLASSGATVALFDTGIALLAGIIMFPALFAAGVEPGAGPGLVFVVLPTIFEAMPAGTLFAIAFYFLLAIAALTSTISLLEVVVSYFVDEKKWPRKRAAWFVGAVCFVLAVPSALSQGAVDWLSSGPWLGGTFLDMQNIIFGNYSLSIGAFMLCLFVGWKWGTTNALGSLEASGHAMPLKGAWSFLIRYLCPLAIMATLIYIIVTGNYL
ncbi:MAG: sodium-dependent transporter, partial [Bacteroidota bacterium]